MIDTIHAVQTPEGVELDLRVAGPVSRALAWLIDALLRTGILLAVSMMIGVLGSFGSGLQAIAAFGVWWFFPVVFEVYSWGQTPGKRVMGLRVVQEDGTPVGWSGSILRNFLRVVDFLPFLYATGLMTMLIDRSFRRLGDLAAGTIVVYTETSTVRAQEIPDLTPLAPPISLALEEQRAVIAFVERSVFLTRERSAELAAIPLPLLDSGTDAGSGADDPQTRLGRIAAFLVGRRGQGRS